VTFANYCILVACLLPFACTLLAKWSGFGKPRREGGFDNRNPRQWLANLAGWQARAHAAQQNSFEALPIFIAGVLIAQGSKAPQAMVDGIALLFVLARIAYIAAYIGDRPAIRSAVWAVGLGAGIALFFVGV
jgi:uncharacterized MAPEG superfamily protein